MGKTLQSRLSLLLKKNQRDRIITLKLFLNGLLRRANGLSHIRRTTSPCEQITSFNPNTVFSRASFLLVFRYDDDYIKSQRIYPLMWFYCFVEGSNPSPAELVDDCGLS